MGSIRVNVRLFATLRRFFPGYNSEKGMDIKVEEGSTIENLIRSLQLPEKEAKVILINGKSKKTSDVITDGDQINIFTPIGGG